MFKVVKNDFMRNFFSPYIWCCIISVCALHYLNVLAESSSGITPDYEEFVFYLDGGFSVVDWIICVIGGGIGFCDEMKSGYFKFNLARIDKSSYCFSKVLNAAISSFLCAFMGLELFHGIYYVFCLCTQHSLEIQQIYIIQGMFVSCNDIWNCFVMWNFVYVWIDRNNDYPRYICFYDTSGSWVVLIYVCKHHIWLS